jgi:sterol desaturase/sphingolipid hydroxylase (fatty acid hydroxylase superfamily)
MPQIDLWTLGAFLSFMALLATVRLSFVSWAEKKLTGPSLYLFNPIWLTPLIFALAWTIGLMIQGQVSPWPPSALEQGRAFGGFWAGLTAFLAAIIVDLWLVWTGASIALRYSAPEQRAKIRGLRFLSIALGGGFLIWMWSIHR